MQRLGDPVPLAALLARHPRRRGVAVARAILEDARIGSTIMRSELEERFLAFLIHHRLPRPEVNANIRTGDRSIECDFAWRARGLDRGARRPRVPRDDRRLRARPRSRPCAERRGLASRQDHMAPAARRPGRFGGGPAQPAAALAKCRRLAVGIGSRPRERRLQRTRTSASRASRTSRSSRTTARSTGCGSPTSTRARGAGGLLPRRAHLVVPVAQGDPAGARRRLSLHRPRLRGLRPLRQADRPRLVLLRPPHRARRRRCSTTSTSATRPSSSTTGAGRSACGSRSSTRTGSRGS